MPVHLLPHDVLPAERSTCVWASTFRSAADERDKMGVVTGTPTFEIGRGVTLNGTTDRISYTLNGQFNIGTISAHLLFYPDTAYTEDASRYLFATTAGSEYSLRKQNNAANNVLSLYLGNTSIVDVAAATYGPLWVTNGRNLITVSGTNSATNMWLNGTQIVTANATAWTAANPAALSVGATVAGAGFFDGRVERLSVYSALSSALAHARIWEGGGA